MTETGNLKHLKKLTKMILNHSRKIFRLRYSQIFMVLTVLTIVSCAKTSFGPVDLKTEYLVHPVGIDSPEPRFTWRLKDGRQGAEQTGYRMVVGTDSLQVVRGDGNIWKTEKINSNKNLITYQGDPLQPFTKYYWKVELWGMEGKKSDSDPVSTFETGMMDSENWTGEWISDNEDIDLKPAPYFRKEFSVNKKIKHARVYIAVGGLFELSLNGEKIGNHRLDPTFTRFDKRILYVTHDVTQQMKKGENAIGVLLGNGWYNHQSTAVWDFHKAGWRARPTFLLDLRITFEDGSIETISSNQDWKTSLSPIIHNSIYTAEHYDARLEQPGWNTSTFDDSNWSPAIARENPTEKIEAQALHPIRNVEEINPKSINKLNDTTYVYDIGKNISGVSQINAVGPAGTVLRIKHGERLYEDGSVDISNIDYHYRPTDDSDPFQTDIFILSGGKEDSFMPHFNYKGFQYIQVTSSTPIELTENNLTTYFMHSDVPVVGKINSSNPTINKIWKATNNSYLSNLFGYPTDCPQREKNGWTGDAHITAETGLYNFDGITVYEKWMGDHRDEQKPNGVLPAIIPTAGWGYHWANGPDWTSTIGIIPWNIYLFYGDTKILDDNYENLKLYVDHLDEISPDGLTSWGLGDWVPVKSKSPVEFTSSTYFFIDAEILANTAKILEKEDDHEKYTALADKIKNAINSKYLNRETGMYGSGLQTELSVALYWGLVPENLIPKVAENLAKRVEADNFHIDVGLLGTKSILNALSENGYADLAYKVASQETYPSWGWWIANGATTLFENWNIEASRDISMNHIMFGEISAWFYKALGGIHPDPNNPGFKNVLLEPHFVEGLDSFGASYESINGFIVSEWKKSGNGINYTVTIPANTTAQLLLPAYENKEIYESGKLMQIDKRRGQKDENSGKNNFSLVAGTYSFEIK